MKYVRKITIAFMAAILLSISTATAAEAIPSVKGAFIEDFETVKETYSDAYKWEIDSISAPSWSVTYEGAIQHMHRRAGYQKQFFEDNVATTQIYLGLISGYGQSMGRNIVEVALGEVGKEDSIEVPARSNNVKYNTWYYGHSVYGEDYPWCSAFISWAADQCGYIDNGLFKRTASSSAQFNHLVNTKGFSAYRANNISPFGGMAYTPKPGDILFFVDADGVIAHIGIIVETGTDYISVVEGNISTPTAPGGGVGLTTYRSANVRTMHPSVYKGFVVNVEYPNVAETIFNFLTKQVGLNTAAACGVLANIEAESNFQPTIEEMGSRIGYGLCQWSFDRRTNLQSWCELYGYDYRTTEGQLWFLKHELETSFKNTTYIPLLNIENTSQGAYIAAQTWCTNYEMPKNAISEAAKRGSNAMNNYWPNYCVKG